MTRSLVRQVTREAGKVAGESNEVPNATASADVPPLISSDRK